MRGSLRDQTLQLFFIAFINNLKNFIIPLQNYPIVIDVYKAIVQKIMAVLFIVFAVYIASSIVASVIGVPRGVPPVKGFNTVTPSPTPLTVSYTGEYVQEVSSGAHPIQSAVTGTSGQYSVGDFCHIPSRTVTGNIEWQVGKNDTVAGSSYHGATLDPRKILGHP